jgi:mannosyltransferase
MIRTRLRNSDQLLMAILVCASITLDLYSLTAKSLWMDEGFSIYMARTDFANFRHIVRSGEINMVLYYQALRIWMLFKQDEFWIRLLSVIPAVLTVPVVYTIGKRLFGTITAFAAAVLFALHPAEVMYAQEVRSYSLVVLLVSLSSLFFLRLIDEPGNLNCMGYLVCSTLAVYAHVFGLLVLISQWLWLAVFFPERYRRRDLLIAAGALVVPQLPLAWVGLRASQAAVNWVPATTLSRILEVWSFLSLPKWRGLLYLAAWSIAMFGLFKTRNRDAYSRYGFLFCWLVLPFVLTLSFSVVKPLLVERFLIVSVPASVLLAAGGLSRLPRSIAVFAFLVIAFVSYNSVLSYYRHLHTSEDWRGATEFVLSHSELGDAVVVLPGYCRYTFDYYRSMSSAPEKPLIDSEFEANHGLSRSSLRTWLLIREFPPVPDPQNFLQSLRDGTNSSYRILEIRRFNLIRLVLLGRRLPD